VSLDLILFYLFFEGGLIPMFLIIGVWGGKDRIYAAFKFFLYTLPRLAADAGGDDRDVLGRGHDRHHGAAQRMSFAAGVAGLPDGLARSSGGFQTLLWLAFFASFAVKMPMWPVHTWLPDAHVQAPTAGFGGAGGDPAEDGRLRLHPLQPADVSR
jgi:NADH-quinone oxidoreductase subunit M